MSGVDHFFIGPWLGFVVIQQVTRRVLHEVSYQPKRLCEESLFTEWKRGNTSYETPRTLAVGEFLFWLFVFSESEPSVLRIRDASCFQGVTDKHEPCSSIRLSRRRSEGCGLLHDTSIP